MRYWDFSHYNLLDYIYEGIGISGDMDKLEDRSSKLAFMALKSKILKDL